MNSNRQKSAREGKSRRSANHRRPYTLGRRLQESHSKRSAILRAARERLERNGYQDLTMEVLASDTGVTRQTVHNLFGTKSQLIEALFDEIAIEGGLNRMGAIMRLHDAHLMLKEFVKVLTGFWAAHGLLIRRIHGIASIDPEFGKAVEERNRRRQMAAARITELLDTNQGGNSGEQARTERVATLYALTSFEFFDSLAESSAKPDVSSQVLALIEKCVIA